MKVEFYDRYLWPTRIRGQSWPSVTGSSESTTDADATRASAMMSPVDYEDRLNQTAQAA